MYGKSGKTHQYKARLYKASCMTSFSKVFKKIKLLDNRNILNILTEYLKNLCY